MQGSNPKSDVVRIHFAASAAPARAGGEVQESKAERALRPQPGTDGPSTDIRQRHVQAPAASAARTAAPAPVAHRWPDVARAWAEMPDKVRAALVQAAGHEASTAVQPLPGEQRLALVQWAAEQLGGPLARRLCRIAIEGTPPQAPSLVAEVAILLANCSVMGAAKSFLVHEMDRLQGTSDELCAALLQAHGRVLQQAWQGPPEKCLERLNNWRNHLTWLFRFQDLDLALQDTHAPRAGGAGPASPHRAELRTPEFGRDFLSRASAMSLKRLGQWACRATEPGLAQRPPMSPETLAALSATTLADDASRWRSVAREVLREGHKLPLPIVAVPRRQLKGLLAELAVFAQELAAPPSDAPGLRNLPLTAAAGQGMWELFAADTWQRLCDIPPMPPTQAFAFAFGVLTGLPGLMAPGELPDTPDLHGPHRVPIEQALGTLRNPHLLLDEQAWGQTLPPLDRSTAEALLELMFLPGSKLDEAWPAPFRANLKAIFALKFEQPVQDRLVLAPFRGRALPCVPDIFATVHAALLRSLASLPPDEALATLTAVYLDFEQSLKVVPEGDASGAKRRADGLACLHAAAVGLQQCDRDGFAEHSAALVKLLDTIGARLPESRAADSKREATAYWGAPAASDDGDIPWHASPAPVSDSKHAPSGPFSTLETIRNLPAKASQASAALKGAAADLKAICAQSSGRAALVAALGAPAKAHTGIQRLLLVQATAPALAQAWTPAAVAHELYQALAAGASTADACVVVRELARLLRRPDGGGGAPAALRKAIDASALSAAASEALRGAVDDGCR